MRRFEIVNGARRNAKPCAVLSWDKRSDSLEIAISPDASQNEVPMMFAPFMKKGQRSIDGEWARRWVQERVVPVERQNLGQVLKANGLSFYDPMQLLINGEGRCAQDDFFIREVEEDGEGAVGATAVGAADAASKRVGAAIAAARHEAGMTQMELAARAKVNQAVISRIERGRGNPTLGLIADIAAALGREVSILL